MGLERGGYGEEESTLVNGSLVVGECGASVLKFRCVFIVREVEVGLILYNDKSL